MGKNYERIRRRARKISRKTNSMMRSIKEIGSLTNKFTAVIFGDPTLERQIEFHIPESKKIPDLNKLVSNANPKLRHYESINVQSADEWWANQTNNSRRYDNPSTSRRLRRWTGKQCIWFDLTSLLIW